MKKKKTSSVFISHSSKDNEFVLWLAGEFKKHGIEFWLDEIEIAPGSGIHKIIGPALKKADRFLIVVSQHYVASHWVEKELHMILNRETKEKREIAIPLLLKEDVEIPPFIDDRKYSDFTSKDNYDRELKKLLKVLGVGSNNEDDETDTGNIAKKSYPGPFLPDLRFFVGRRGLLAQIKETLAVDHRVVMHDISGLGKSFTSYKFVQESHADYEKVFFVRATKEEWLESLAKCGESVDPELANSTEQAARAGGFKQWLEENDGWLIIYDNVDLPEDLSFLVPANSGGDCIFTSNSGNAAFLGTEIRIDKMDTVDAGILLYSRALGKPLQRPELEGTEKTAFDGLIEEIDGLPVTLNSTGAVIFKRKLKFSRFWEIYSETPEIAWEGEDPYSAYQHKSAGKIFSLVYDELCESDKIGAFVETVLDSMSFISPDEIPDDLLRQILEARNESFAQSEDPDGLWDDIREKLTAYDLLKYDWQKETFTTHRAIQRVIQSQLKGQEKDICVSLAAVLRRLFPTYDYTNRGECEKYYQHVLVLVENADRFGAETEGTNELYFRLGRYHYRLGNYSLAERFLIRAAETSATVSGAESESHATDLNDLAEVYRIQGKYNEALKKLEEVLRIAEKTTGKENSNYAAHLTVLALIYKSQGRYDEAAEKYEEALRIDEKTIGREHPDHATRLNNLANVYSNQGRHDEAIKKFEEALRIDEKTIGEEHPSYAIRLNNLALVYKAQGRYDEAIEKLEEALRIDEKTVGREHPDYAVHVSNLAAVHEARGEYQRALEMYEESLRIREKTLPPEHPYIAQDRKSVERCKKLVGRVD